MNNDYCNSFEQSHLNSIDKIQWNSEKPLTSIHEFASWAITNALGRIQSYNERRNDMRRCSRFIRQASIVLIILGGLIPILQGMFISHSIFF